jgi:secreted PhoX family phosphatase
MSDERARAALPRRALLKAAAAAAAFLGSILAAARASASAKMTQKLVRYQTTPKGSARCQTCAQYLPTPACKLVDDPISPNGWCQLYAAKA